MLGCILARTATAAAPLIDAVDTSDGERNVNVFVQLRCSAQYLGRDATDEGTSITMRLRPGPDCGFAGFGIATERAASVGTSRIVTAVRIEETLPGEIALTVEWKGRHHFVATPTTDSRGLRVRILDVFDAPQANVAIEPVDSSETGYAVNLDSSRTAFTDADIAAAAQQLGAPVHVSAIELAGEQWYRLRAGPFDARRDAERLLAQAQVRYPRAWLGINDETAAPPATPAAPITPPTPASGVDAPLADAERAVLFKQARAAMAARDYTHAIELLTKLTRQPEYPGRAAAQELLGLARERSGQLAHAKAEYEEYLARYPGGDAARRTRERLRALASASRNGRRGTRGGGGDDDDEHAWRISGGASQFYRWEKSQLDTTADNTTREDQNGLYTDADFIARRSGTRFDIVSRVAAGYAHDMLTDGPGNQARVSAAFFELTDRSLGLATRVGRQSRNTGGLLGTFDGVFSSYQLRPRVAINVAAGFPVESTRESPETDRRFFGLSTEIGPFNDRWDFGAFAVMQQLAGETDRQGVGLEGRYFVPGRTLLGMIDYDLHYQEINGAVLMGSWQLPARWAVSFSGDHRRSPVLTTRNALIGQPVQSLDQLLTLYTPAEIEQLARDRTPLADLFSIAISRPLGERFQFSLEGYGSRFSQTVASGNVAATPASGLEKTVQLQLSANSFMHSNDLWVFAARYQDGAQATTRSLLVASRLPVGGAWRLGPRLRVDRRDSTLDGSRENLYVPTLRLDYVRGRTWFECEAGTELGKRTLTTDEETTKRYYFGLGYRLSF